MTIPSGCTPSKFYLVSRHGTRLPSTSKTEKLMTLPTYQAEILKTYANGKQPAVGALCAADLALLTKWRWDSNITSSMDEYLTGQGWNDLKGMAQYYKSQYPTLLGAYSADKYHFRHTDTQRTQASFQGFVDGLFGDGSHKNIPAEAIPAEDTLLRPHENCAKWKDQEAALEKSSSELSKFEASNLYLGMIDDVAAKAGYKSGDIKANRIKWMFEMCFYDLAWKTTEDSPWCSLFTLEQAKIFEYAKDIEEWNLGGSASTLNTRLSCFLMQDMLSKLESGKQATAYFAHSTTLQLFLTGLGYAIQDTPLRADNFAANVNRKFVTSKVSVLATNVAAVRYECTSGTKIQFILNERPLQLDWCDNGLCDWTQVKAKFASIAAANCPSYYCTS